MPADHPMARRRDLTWRDLKDVPLIGPPPGNAVREQLDFALARLAVSLGLAIKKVTGPVIKRETSLLFHADRSLSPAAQNFRDLLLDRRSELEQG